VEGNGLSDRFYPFIWLKALAARHREYAGVSMGFGPALFGHSPDFVVRALEDQIKSGIEIGPQSALAGEVARLICHFTGMERAIFCNTGSEAVLAALLEQPPGRSKIALFGGSSRHF
jgi:glutamate-1-semialdehyde aminotransferase